MQEFTYGDYTLIELAMAQFIKDLSPDLTVTQSCMNIISKTEIEMRKLREAAKDQSPESLALPAKPEVKA